MVSTPARQGQFEEIVKQFYVNLYRFALSLSRTEDTACDLVQQTFLQWARKGHQLRDPAKVKAWLFTTLHREFLGLKRKESRAQLYSIEAMESETPHYTPDIVRQVDSKIVIATLHELDETFRVPLMLFHLEDYSYAEIADILEIPIGTVMSRLARGREHLFRILADFYSVASKNIVKMPTAKNPMEKRGNG